ncbi:Neuroligin-4, X-linked [Folsomia candida]|uniref:Neuroligin-4, X-linked n=1 Tax=Folsomia candida TaxID=158441 RepID=A0A226DLU4_FOLCA|nr:Neuroligin-4, X-linked [Folsomia candida]
MQLWNYFGPSDDGIVIESGIRENIVSPLVKLGELHSQGSSRTYFYVFEYQSKVSDYVQRLGCVHGEDLHYVFGVPLFLSSANAEHPEWDDPHQNNAGVGGGDAGKLGVFSGNFTRNEVQLSHTVLHYWVNFIKTGNPNAEPTSTPSSEGSPSSSSSQGSSGGGVSLGGSTGENRFPHQDKSSSSSVMSVKPKLIEWPPYDSLFKKYLSIEAKPRIRNHYRAHRLSFWLHLVPELMRNGGGGGISMFQNRPEGHVINSSNSTVQHPPSIQLVGPPYWEQHPFYYSSGNYSSYPGGDISGPLGSRPHHRFHNDHSNGIGGGDPGGFQIYSTALSVTIAVGCSFLILNILVFVAFYYFRDKRRAARHSRGGESEPYRNHPGPISASGDGLDHPTSYPTSADLQLSVDPTTTKGQSASTYSSADTMVLPSIHNTPVRLQENGQIPNFHQQQRHHHQNQHQMLPMPNICGDLPISANLQQLLAESAANSGGGRTSSPYQHANPSQNQAPTFMLGGASTSTSTSTLPSNKRQGQRSSSSGGSSTLGGHSFELSMPDAILAAAMMLNYRQNNSSQVSSSGGGSDFFLGTGHKSSSAAGKRPALNMKEQLLLSAGISDAATSAVGFTSAPGPGSGGNGGRTGVIVGNLPGSRGSVPYNNNATGGGGGESGCGNVIQFDFENASKSVPRPPKRQTPSVKFSPDTFISPDGSICSGPNANVNTSPVVVTAPNSAPILTANATPTSTSSSVSSISTNSANNPSQLKSSLKKHSNYSPAQDQLNV